MALPLLTDLGPGSPNAPYAFDNGGNTSQGTGPFTTSPDFTPAPNSLLLVFAGFGLPSDVTVNEPSYILTDTISPDLNWQKIVAATASFGGDGSAVQAWYAEVGDNPAPLSLILTHTGLTTYAMSLYVINIIGHQVGDAIVQVGEAVNTNNDFDITFASPPGADSLLISMMQLVGNAQATNVVITPDAGWTEHANHVANNSFVRSQVQYGPGSLGSTLGRTATTTTGAPFNQRVGVAVEIRAESTAIVVDAVDVAVMGQDVPLGDYHIIVTPASAAVAGQDVDIVNPVIDVTGYDIAIAAQNVNLIGGDVIGPDLMSAFYIALSDDTYITSRLGEFMSPSIHTRVPVPEGAGYPMIVVRAQTVVDEDALVTKRPVVSVIITIYGEQDDQYRTVEELGYYINTKFHRQKYSISPSGYKVIDIVAAGPTPAPTDDFQHVARMVALAVRLQEA